MRNSTLIALAVTTVLTPISAVADEKVTLNWALWDWAAIPYYEPIIEAYEAKNPNIEIEYVDLGSTDYSTMVMTQLTGGADDLDIVTVKDIPGYANLVRTGGLLELSENVQSGAVDVEGFGGLVEEMTTDSGIYALPFRSDFWLLYYNKDLFDAANVDYPTNDMTWDEWAEKSAALTSGIGQSKVYGSFLHTWRSTVQLPGILDGSNTLVGGNYDFLKPHYERALALQESGSIPKYGSLKASKTHYSGPFYNETVAMLPIGSWFIGMQIGKLSSGESLAENWGLAKYPHPDGVAPGTTSGQVTGLGVNANSEHQAEALDFINFATGPEGAAIVAATGTFPAMKTDEVVASIAASPGFPQDQQSRDALKVTKSYLEMAVDLHAAKIDVVLNRHHDAIMTGSISVEEGIALMNADVQAILSE